MGQNEFRRIWGNRPLEDNWRRSTKTLQTFEKTEEDAGNEETDEPAELVVESAEDVAAAKFSTMYTTIPFSDTEKQEALNKVEDALFKLGNIYYFDLREYTNAIQTFESFMDRFDPSEHSPEVIFKLYLLYNNIDQTEMASNLKEQLISTYPESNFAKELINPDYEIESQQANDILVLEYQKAYKFYQLENFSAADSVAQRAIESYPEGNYVPRLLLLQIMILGKTGDLYQYQLQLSDFIEAYPDNEISPFAQELLIASDRFKEGLIKLKDAAYEVEEASEHYFIVTYERSQTGNDELIAQIEDFNTKNYMDENLKTGTLKLDESKAIVLVDHFKDQQDALLYYDLWKANNTVATENPSFKFDTFVISKNNFDVLYKTKELDTYKTFYSRHY
jgi:outer membrane protein assembly factor BamD (BamD/ComL family)